MQKGLHMAKKNLELVLVGEKVRDDSVRIKKLLELIHAYRFDDYNSSAFEQVVTIALNKQEFEEINETGMSANKTLERVLEEAPETTLMYAWWQHYYNYFPELVAAYNDFMGKIDMIPPINSFQITDAKGREKFVDNELANAVEKEMLAKLRPKPLVEFLVKLTAEYSRHFRATQFLTMSLSGYTLFDEFQRVGLPKIAELSGWMSPKELETKRHEEELAEAKRQEEIAYKAKIDKLKEQLTVRYNKALAKYIETLIEAYSKLRDVSDAGLSEVKSKKRIEHFNSVLDGIKVKAMTTFKSNTWAEELALSFNENETFVKSLQNKALSNVDNLTRVVLNQTSLMFWNGLSDGLSTSDLKKEMMKAFVK